MKAPSMNGNSNSFGAAKKGVNTDALAAARLAHDVTERLDTPEKAPVESVTQPQATPAKVSPETIATNWHITAEGDTVIAYCGKTGRHFKGSMPEFKKILRGE